MKISLIHPFYRHKAFSENLRFIDEEFCKAPPIILAYVAAILQKAGHAVQIVDAYNANLSDEEVLRRVQNFCPDLLGFRLDTYCFHDARRMIKYLKDKLRGIKVLCGGINLSLYPEESFSHNLIDYGFIGDAIGRLPKVIDCIEKNTGLESIHGTIFLKGQKTNIVPYQKELDNEYSFDDYPFPARGLLENSIYYSIISQRRNYTVMLASRGCPYHCKFCAIANIAYSYRSADSIIKEIEECYYRFGIREIDFFDAVFFLNRGNIRKVFDELIRMKLDLEWSCRSRVDDLDEEFFKKARKAGCRQIYFGIESCDPMILSNIEKQTNPSQICQALQLCKKVGIRTLGFFMIGNQGENRETVIKTVNSALSLPLDYAQFCMAIAKPFTKYDRERIQRLGRDYWREYIRRDIAEQPFPRTWTNLTNDEVVKLTWLAYRKFYLRLNHIFTMLYQARSFKELLRYIWVGGRLIGATLKFNLAKSLRLSRCECEQYPARSAGQTKTER